MIACLEPRKEPLALTELDKDRQLAGLTNWDKSYRGVLLVRQEM